MTWRIIDFRPGPERYRAVSSSLTSPERSRTSPS
jgi:hypothetical protein